MIGNLLILALTSFVGVSCAVPLMDQAQLNQNEINYVSWDDVSGYTSDLTYLPLTFYGESINANVFVKDSTLNIDDMSSTYHLYGQRADGSYYRDFGFGTPSIIDALIDEDLLYVIYEESDASNHVYRMIPYWNYLHIDNYWNDTLMFYISKNDSFQLQYSYIEFNGLEVANLPFNQTFYISNNLMFQYGFNGASDIVLGGNFSFVIGFVNSDDLPNYSFAIGSFLENNPYYSYGYNDGFNNGRSVGYAEGLEYGETSGYQNGYTSGYNTGLSDGLNMAQSSNFNSLFNAIADTPVVFMRSLFGFELFGMNVFAIIMSLITGLIVIYVIKKVWK